MSIKSKKNNKKRKHIKKSKRVKFAKINAILDSEHNDIIDTADNLYKVCLNHWKTEEKLYKQGVKQPPSGHKEVSTNWKEHNLQHKLFLQKIKGLKKEIINHINTYDIRDFHWLKQN